LLSVDDEADVSFEELDVKFIEEVYSCAFLLYHSMPPSSSYLLERENHHYNDEIRYNENKWHVRPQTSCDHSHTAGMARQKKSYL